MTSTNADSLSADSTRHQAARSKRPLRRKRNWRRWIERVLVPIIVALIGTNIWQYLNYKEEDRDAPREIRVEIPANGQGVSQFEPVSGRSTNLRQGEVIWIVIRPIGGKFYPADYPCVNNGDSWHCPSVTIGVEEDQGTFELIPTYADGKAMAVYLDYHREASKTGIYPGMDGLPVGAGIVENSTVVVRRE